MYTNEEYQKAKYRDSLPLKCLRCGKTFQLTKKRINAAANPNHSSSGKFCSFECFGSTKIVVSCSNCGRPVERIPSADKYKQNKNCFCNHSCNAQYQNAHRKSGYRRSKLEAWLEQQLSSLYPNLEIHFNRKDAIESELDIYIPPLKLAFELNGVFHYEPIYGSEKLQSIQNNDSRKFAACAEKQISLCIIDTSKQKYFKESTSQMYLDIITHIITERIALVYGIEPMSTISP